ncbi:unnamed protein product [Gongylonema pulchrum]|uniref:Uncharacterized protein n=1 Tax=Gongylonema pulchrum TaxID=637853 RepID=A0A183E762_9BILA|nr:unnamed protein product [Gongylonema pulchrum]
MAAQDGISQVDTKRPNNTSRLRRVHGIQYRRKIFFIEQLYGWRGMDTGYYGSESSDELSDLELSEPKVQQQEEEAPTESEKVT